MRIFIWLSHQIADLFSDFLIPALTAPLPRSWANRFSWWAAGIKGLFPGSARAIKVSEAQCFDMPGGLRRRWAWSTLMEASEAWRLIFRMRPRLTISGEWPDQPGFIAAGMHYGPGICALWHLQESGFRPRFVYRPVTRRDVPGRPLKLGWYKLRARLVKRLCPDGPIATGGASAQIIQALNEGCSTPVLLFDTPTAHASEWHLRIGHARIPLRSGGAAFLGPTIAKIAFFAVSVDSETGVGRLTIAALEDDRSIQGQVMEMMEEAINRDPGQWLLWHGVEGLFSSLDQEPPTPRV